MLETIDLTIRSACIGICLIMAVHFASIRPVSRKTVSALGLLAAAAGLIIISAIAMPMDNQTLLLVRTIIVAISPALIAWGLLELFEDDFQIQTWQIAFVTVSVPTHFLTWLDPAFGFICHGSSLLIYAYIFYITITTHTHDLVHARCMFRRWFMLAAAIDGIIFTSLHWLYGETMPPGIELMKGATMLVLAIIFAYYALKVREHVWALPQNARMTTTDNMSPAEVILLAKLKTSMEDNIWRQEGLTIRVLAEALEVPEHRLRKVINQGLGYRNFAAFVNEHRIEAACEVLADPVRADIPVITIAYEVGYASLGPFNRAFKEIVGESPTEFRKRSFSHA